MHCQLICFIGWLVGSISFTYDVIYCLQVSRLHTSSCICWMLLDFIVQHCMCLGFMFVVLLDKSWYTPYFILTGIFVIVYADIYLESYYYIILPMSSFYTIQCLMCLFLLPLNNQMESSSRISRIRNRELERLRGPPWFKVGEDSSLLVSIMNS